MKAGIHDLKLHVAGEQADSIVRADAAGGAMTMAYRANDMRVLLYPRVAALPSGGPVASLAIDYPRARGEFAGLSRPRGSSSAWSCARVRFAKALRRQLLSSR
jgi:hypothetical protein